jgi:DMSO/TMAO reductase YedYZ heme-binding membrane subunit
MHASQSARSDWPLTSLIATLLCLTTAIPFLLNPTDLTEATRAAIRLTARTSLVLFSLAFMAAGLTLLLPGGVTGWLKQNRRSFGLSFAFSHLLHALMLGLLYGLDRALFLKLTNIVSYIAGGSCYAVILLLAATSLGPVRQRLSRSAWQTLHRYGVWYIWLFFLVNFGRRAVLDGSYWPAMLLIAAALCVRVGARFRLRPAT